MFNSLCFNKNSKQVDPTAFMEDLDEIMKNQKNRQSDDLYKIQLLVNTLRNSHLNEQYPSCYVFLEIIACRTQIRPQCYFSVTTRSLTN